MVFDGQVLLIIESFVIMTIEVLVDACMTVCKEIFKFSLLLICLSYFSIWIYHYLDDILKTAQIPPKLPLRNESQIKLSQDLDLDIHPIVGETCLRIGAPDEDLIDRRASLLEQLEIEAEFELNQDKSGSKTGGGDSDSDVISLSNVLIDDTRKKSAEQRGVYQTHKANLLNTSKLSQEKEPNINNKAYDDKSERIKRQISTANSKLSTTTEEDRDSSVISTRDLFVANTVTNSSETSRASQTDKTSLSKKSSLKNDREATVRNDADEDGFESIQDGSSKADIRLNSAIGKDIYNDMILKKDLLLVSTTSNETIGNSSPVHGDKINGVTMPSIATSTEEKGATQPVHSDTLQSSTSVTTSTESDKILAVIAAAENNAGRTVTPVHQDRRESDSSISSRTSADSV